MTSTGINKTWPLLLRSWLRVGYGKNHAYLKQSERVVMKPHLCDVMIQKAFVMAIRISNI